MSSRIITAGAALLFIAWILLEAFFSAPAEKNASVAFFVLRLCGILAGTGLLLIIIRLGFGFKVRQPKEGGGARNLYLITYGTKLAVQFSACEIVPLENSSLLKYTTVVNESPAEFFSSPITIYPHRLPGLLLAQKQTFIYINAQDPSSYFFDTDFLR